MGINWLLLIHGYGGYPVIPNPLETFIIKKRQQIGIVTERNCGKKEGANKSEKISWKNTDKKELKLKALQQSFSVFVFW